MRLRLELVGMLPNFGHYKKLETRHWGEMHDFYVSKALRSEFAQEYLLIEVTEQTCRIW